MNGNTNRGVNGNASPQDFKTTDIVLASTLKIKGYDLYNIVKNGNKGTFCFKAVDPKIIAEYDLCQVFVEPMQFNNTIKALTTATRR